MWYIPVFYLSLVLLNLPFLVAECSSKIGYGPDLPNPPTIWRHFHRGAWIVPMDEKQEDEKGVFNMQAYGYIVRCLWDDLEVFWVIKACKSQDEIDFSAKVKQILPYQHKEEYHEDEFRYGAFIIPSFFMAMAPYKNLVINESLGMSPPAVYRLEENIELEVRHTWTDKPRIAVLGKKRDYHTDILEAAGLIPGVHYVELKNFSADACFTFVSNPHDPLDGEEVRALHVADFTLLGGNFLAQCKAARTYGMYAAHHGRRFLLTTQDAGRSIISSIDECSVRGNPKYDVYCPAISDGAKQWRGNGKIPWGKIRHPDLPYMQFNQAKGFHFNVNGSWKSGDIVSIEDKFDHQKAYIELSNDEIFKAMAGKIIGYEGSIGGNVYFLAGHRYYYDCNPPLCSVNAWRMYMNAAITPSAPRPESCELHCCEHRPQKHPTPAPPSRAPTRRPTKAPTKYKCHNLPRWKDTHRKSCKDLEKEGLCRDGRSISIEVARRKDKKGRNASSACCACGERTFQFNVDTPKIVSFKFSYWNKDYAISFRVDIANLGIDLNRLSVYEVERPNGVGYAYVKLLIGAGYPSATNIGSLLQELVDDGDSEFLNAAAARFIDKDYPPHMETYEPYYAPISRPNHKLSAGLIYLFIILFFIIAMIGLVVYWKYRSHRNLKSIEVDYINLVKPTKGSLQSDFTSS